MFRFRKLRHDIKLRLGCNDVGLISEWVRNEKIDMVFETEEGRGAFMRCELINLKGLKCD